MYHLVNGRLDKLGGIQRYLVLQFIGKAFGLAIQRGIDLFRDSQGFGAGLLVYRNEGGLLAL